MRFRALNNKERRIISRGEEEFGADLQERLRDKTLIVSLNGRKEVFATNEKTFKVLQQLKVRPYFAGLYLGEIKGNKFLFGLEGGDILSSTARRKVIVDDSVEQLVLYGRDVFINSILKAYPGMKKGDKCLILNRKGEFLAIGRVEDKIIKNLLDRGWYLRKGE